MTTKWAHLPNAVHIDRVNASVLANPDHWKVHSESQAAARRKTPEAARARAGREAIQAIQIEPGKYAAWVSSRAVVDGIDTWVVRGAVLALIAYDDCAYMLDSDPGELAILAEFGDNRAILLLPACKVVHSLEESA